METKKCSHCKEKLPIEMFYNNKSRKDGKRDECKKCCGKYNFENREKRRTIQKKWLERNKGYSRKYYLENRDKILFHLKHNKKDSKRRKIYMKKYIKKYWKKYGWRYHRERMNDPKKHLNYVFNISINRSLKLKRVGRRWEKLIGYSLIDLMNHLEKQFDGNMSWFNYGSYWHIDHIIPKFYFDFSSENDREFKQCWALANLQPLEAKENLRKNKYLNFKKTLDKPN